MNLLRDLPLHATVNGDLYVVVETPKGSAIKLKYDEHYGVFEWSRPLLSGLTFPHDFGFFPQTLGGDGDALDAMVLSDVASYPGVVVPVRTIGALRVEQTRDQQPAKRNDRVMVIPCNQHRQAEIQEVADLSARFRQEIEAFFTASLSLTGKQIKFCGWADAAEARDIVDAAAARYASGAKPA